MVAPFPNAIGRKAVVRWPGGVSMQLCWRTAALSYAPLATTPENRVYLSADRADAFVHAFLSFLGGAVCFQRRDTAMVRFPGGYIAEIHAERRPS